MNLDYSKVKKLIRKGGLFLSLYAVLHSSIGVTKHIIDSLSFNHKYYKLSYPSISAEIYINKIELSFPYISPKISHQLILRKNKNDRLIMKKYSNDKEITLEQLLEKNYDEIISVKDNNVNKSLRSDIDLRSIYGVHVYELFRINDDTWRRWINEMILIYNKPKKPDNLYKFTLNM